MNKKGNPTSCITIRLDDDVIKLITDKANKLGFDTAGAYLKSQILKSLESVNKKPISVEGEMLPVNPPVNTITHPVGTDFPESTTISSPFATTNKRYKKPPQGKGSKNYQGDR